MNKKKYTYERAEWLPFYLFTHAHYGTDDPFDLGTYQRDKAFCEYQCQCAKMGVAYENPERYGVRGLFG